MLPLYYYYCIIYWTWDPAVEDMQFTILFVSYEAHSRVHNLHRITHIHTWKLQHQINTTDNKSYPVDTKAAPMLHSEY